WFYMSIATRNTLGTSLARDYARLIHQTLESSEVRRGEEAHGPGLIFDTTIKVSIFRAPWCYMSIATRNTLGTSLARDYARLIHQTLENPVIWHGYEAHGPGLIFDTTIKVSIFRAPWFYMSIATRNTLGTSLARDYARLIHQTLE